jgi:hypothetical protein
MSDTDGVVSYGPRGPYGTELEAIGASGQRDRMPGEYAAHNLARLIDTVDAAGVALGSYDLRILTWLAGHAEPQAVEVLAAIIERAAARRR